MIKEKKDQLMAKLLEKSYVPGCEACGKVVTKDGRFARVVKYVDIMTIMREFKGE